MVPNFEQFQNGAKYKLEYSRCFLRSLKGDDISTFYLPFDPKTIMYRAHLDAFLYTLVGSLDVLAVCIYARYFSGDYVQFEKNCQNIQFPRRSKKRSSTTGQTIKDYFKRFKGVNLQKEDPNLYDYVENIIQKMETTDQYEWLVRLQYFRNHSTHRLPIREGGYSFGNNIKIMGYVKAEKGAKVNIGPSISLLFDDGCELIATCEDFLKKVEQIHANIIELF